MMNLYIKCRLPQDARYRMHALHAPGRPCTLLGGIWWATVQYRKLDLLWPDPVWLYLCSYDSSQGKLWGLERGTCRWKMLAGQLLRWCPSRFIPAMQSLSMAVPNVPGWSVGARTAGPSSATTAGSLGIPIPLVSRPGRNGTGRHQVEWDFPHS